MAKSKTGDWYVISIYSKDSGDSEKVAGGPYHSKADAENAAYHMQSREKSWRWSFEARKL